MGRAGLAVAASTAAEAIANLLEAFPLIVVESRMTLSMGGSETAPPWYWFDA